MLLMRKMNINDMNFIVNAERTFIKTHGPGVSYTYNFLKKTLRHQGVRIYVGEIYGIQVSYVILSYAGDGLWSLDAIYTKPGFRKKGYIKKIFKYALNDVKSKFWTKTLKAENLISDEPSDHFLLSVGFVLKETDPSLYKNRGGRKYLWLID